MDAYTVKTTADQSEREDAARFLRAALAAVEAGQWSSAKVYMNGAKGIALDVLRSAGK